MELKYKESFYLTSSSILAIEQVQGIQGKLLC